MISCLLSGVFNGFSTASDVERYDEKTNEW